MHAYAKHVGRSPTDLLRFLFIILLMESSLPGQSLLSDAVWAQSTQQGVSSVALSGDETFLVSAGAGIKMWRFSTPDLLQTLDPVGNYSSVALSSDGALLFSAEKTNHNIIVWQMSSGTRIQTWAGGQTPLNTICLSPDDSLLAIGSGNAVYPGPLPDGAVQVWSAREGVLIRTFTNQIQAVTGVAFSQDSQLLAAASGDQTIYLWRVSDGALLWSIPGTDGYRPAKVAFSPDGQTLAYGGGFRPSYAAVVRVSDGTPLWLRSAHENELNALEFAPDGSFLVSAGARNHTDLGSETNYPSIILFDPATGNRKGIIPSPMTPIQAVTITHDSGGVLASDLKLWGTNGSPVRTWSVNHMPAGCGGGVTALAFSTTRDELLAAHSCISTLKLWKASDGTLLRTNPIPVDPITAIAYSPDDTKVALGASSVSGATWVLNATNWSVLSVTGIPNGSVTCLAWSHSGLSLAVGESQGAFSQIFLRNATNGTVLQSFGFLSTNVLALTVLPSDNDVASLSMDGTVQFWNLFGQGQSFQLPGTPVCAAFSPDSSFLVAAYGNRDLQVVRLSDGTVLQTLRGHTNVVRCLAVSADAQLIYSAAQNELLLWRTADGLLLKRYTQEVFDATSLAASPRGDTFAFGNTQPTVLVARKPDFFLPVGQPQGGALTLSFSGVNGLLYALERSADFQTWQTWTNVACSNSPASVLAPLTGFGPEFQRLKRQ